MNRIASPLRLGLLLLAIGLVSQGHTQSLELDPTSTVRLMAGQQTLRTLENAATARILDPAVARVSSESPDRILLSALAPGQTYLTYRTPADAPVSELVVVVPPPRGLALEIQNLVAGISGIQVYEANKRVVLDGRIPSLSDIERIKKITEAFGDQILDLTRLDTGASNDLIADFIRRNAGIDGLDITILGDTAYLRGTVPNEASRSNVLALARTQIANVMDLLEVHETMIETEVLFIRAEKTKGHSWGKNLFDGSDAIKLQAGLSGSQDYAQNVWSPAALGITWSASVAPVLNALIDAGKAEVVARPRVGTRLGQKGRFLSGGEMYYKVSGEVSGGLESVEYGIDLSVVPVYLIDNTICNTLTMTLSFPVSQAGTSDLSLDKYTIESTIVCKVGQSVVISGIAEQIANQTKAHTPILGSIPLVRLLFSESNRSFKNSEIIAIITPRIMNPELNRLRNAEDIPQMTVVDQPVIDTGLATDSADATLQDQPPLAGKEAKREAARARKEAARQKK